MIVLLTYSYTAEADKKKKTELARVKFIVFSNNVIQIKVLKNGSGSLFSKWCFNPIDCIYEEDVR